MNRVIKFRAYVIPPEDNHEHSEMIFSGDGENICKFFKELHRDSTNRFISKLMQFTGLHDKNGKEIYEGDILKIISLTNEYNQRGSIEVFDVVFHNGCFRMKSRGSYGAKIEEFLITHTLEIIGNIYENPELIDE